jgi:hypothetical protein
MKVKALHLQRDPHRLASLIKDHEVYGRPETFRLEVLGQRVWTRSVIDSQAQHRPVGARRAHDKRQLHPAIDAGLKDLAEHITKV